ncbi:glycosyltransferase [Maribacter sp. 1_MG-2023]|uniref:glycosyltransferase family 2 protein n=1 Tax=Maribacter sp. 1_MG-2023 TaxID=3062677 RepID=UPI0026E42C2B|nr:glycosyltransferase [Maribacter sp. 1_MG-2023]MDO6472368.1 glycosyltransferase [Maribacter sp. 1_MG-2023]
MIKIVIVIPSFNEEKNIIATLKTILVQISNYKDYSFQLIVLDDFSTDESLFVLNKFKDDTFNELQIISNSINKGIVKSTKKLFEEALKSKADFILKCDMDSDFPHAIFLDTFINYIKESQPSFDEILVGERQIENVITQSTLEIQERAKMELYLNENLNITNFNPVSSGVLLYGKNVLKIVLQQQVVKEYNLKWGLDFLLPLVAIKLNYKVVKSKINNGTYTKERRPRSKIKAQYSAYYHILNIIKNTYQ